MVFEQFTEDVNRDQHGFTKNQIKLLKFLVYLLVSWFLSLFSPFFIFPFLLFFPSFLHCPHPPSSSFLFNIS